MRVGLNERVCCECNGECVSLRGVWVCRTCAVCGIGIEGNVCVCVYLHQRDVPRSRALRAVASGRTELTQARASKSSREKAENSCGRGLGEDWGQVVCVCVCVCVCVRGWCWCVYVSV